MKKRNWNILLTDECDSTNSRIKQLKHDGELTDRTALMTYFQHNGRGQGKNSWHSTRHKNVLASLFLEINLPVKFHFMLNIITSLAIVDVLDKHGIVSQVKWPNDIYCGDKKIAGILIENVLMRDIISESIIGIGLNVNEQNFPDWLPNPCSMKDITGADCNLKDILQEITDYISDLLNQFRADKGEELFHRYQSILYRSNRWHLFRIEGKTINARIRGVELDGRLIVETNAGSLQHYLFGEIEYVIR